MKAPLFWRRNHSLRAYLLTPLSWLYLWIVKLRKQRLILQSEPFSCPIVIIGNISAGGSGKSPMVIALTQHLQLNGLSVGIISRGYGARMQHKTPYFVTAQDNASICGDEPLLIHQQTGAPVVVSIDRNQAVKCLIKQHGPQVIISDDGLQHYALHRDIEIIMLSESSLGNQKALPAGPLREPMARLKLADFVISKTTPLDAYPSDSIMNFSLPEAVNLLTNERRPLSDFQQSTSLKAIAGIAFPEHFFQQLSDQGLIFDAEALPDHAPFNPSHLNTHKSVLMTSKDAVKCRSLCADLHLNHCWEVLLDVSFTNNILNNIQHRIERFLPSNVR